MAGQDSGDKTEKPTPKKLRDARRKGDVAKSKDVGPAFTLILFTIVLIMAGGFLFQAMAELFQTTITVATSHSFADAGQLLGSAALRVLLIASAIVLLPLAVAGVIAEFAQVGPLFTGEKLKFGLDKLNPVDGFKRMFGKDALAELVKNLVKAGAVIAVCLLVIQTSLPDIGALGLTLDPSPLAERSAAVAGRVADLTGTLTLRLFGWTCMVFILVAAADRLWSQHSFLKKMRMSHRDIRQEHKQDEGDPHIKSNRKQLHEQWANSNAVASAGDAAALLVNPTHLAIALDYDAKTCPVPVIAARGEGPLAAAMRAAAEDGKVPIIRNVGVARRLWARGEVGEIVPEDMFEAIAEVILWAQKARKGEAPMSQDLGRHQLETLGED